MATVVDIAGGLTGYVLTGETHFSTPTLVVPVNTAYVGTFYIPTGNTPIRTGGTAAFQKLGVLGGNDVYFFVALASASIDSGGSSLTLEAGVFNSVTVNSL